MRQRILASIPLALVLVGLSLFTVAEYATAAGGPTLLATVGDRAIFLIDGERRSLRVGESTPDFTLLSITDSAVMIESGGRTRSIALGQGYVATTDDAASTGRRLILSPDGQGQYFADVTVNGHRERGVIDTGATHLTMSRATANAMDIDYPRGKRGIMQTAGGTMNVWLIEVPQVQVGTITLYGVDVVVRDSRGQIPLLIGTSLLNRFQMSRDQSLMILSTKP